MTDPDTAFALIGVLICIAVAVPVGLMPRTKLSVVKWSFIVVALIVVSVGLYDMLTGDAVVITPDSILGLFVSVGLLLLFSLALRTISDLCAKHCRGPRAE